MDKPKVSVVMPVWNTPEEYLREAVESILTQTFSDFEFIIVDDGSTKHNVTAILESYRDERIILIKNKVNAGVSRARNLGMKKSRGDYVALMDADDVSYPERLQKEVDFLDRHPEIAMVSTGKRFIPAGRAEVPEFANGKLRDYLLFRGCFIQTGAVMMRRTVFEDYGLYFNPELDVAEDYDMWLRQADKSRFANLPAILMNYRWGGQNISILQNDKQVLAAAQMQSSKWIEIAGCGTELQPLLINFISKKPLTEQELASIADFISAMLKKLENHPHYNRPTAEKYLQKLLKRIIRNTPDRDYARRLLFSPLAKKLKLPWLFTLTQKLSK